MAELVKSEQWKTTKFILIPDNPIQRNTEIRAHAAASGHLKEFHPTHARVAVANVGKKYFKLDGHTRSHLWRTGRIKGPEKVWVDIYSCKNIDEVKDIYRQFDAQVAMETMQQTQFGELRGLGLTLSSTYVRNASLNTALRMLDPSPGARTRTGRTPLKELLERFLPIIQDIDTMQIKSKRFVTPLAAAMILTMQRRKIAKKFWSAYNGDLGVKDGTQRNAVYCLDEYVKNRRIEGRLSGFSNNVEVAAYAIACCDYYIVDEWVTNYRQIKKVEFKKYRNVVLKDWVNELDAKAQASKGGGVQLDIED